jgi:hypothetical protein
MPNLALVQEYSGYVDFNRVSPILEEENGRRWNLRNADGLAAIEIDAHTLEVKAILATADPFAPA